MIEMLDALKMFKLITASHGKGNIFITAKDFLKQ